MKPSIPLLAVLCLTIGAILLCPSIAPGVVVPASETSHLMGSQCYAEDSIQTVCYGMNCLSGGCGCSDIWTLKAGYYSITWVLTYCADSHYCSSGNYQTTGYLCGS